MIVKINIDEEALKMAAYNLCLLSDGEYEIENTLAAVNKYKESDVDMCHEAIFIDGKSSKISIAIGTYVINYLLEKEREE